MAFSNVWDNTFPPDTQAADQINVDQRSTKTDIQQRLAAMTGSIGAPPNYETGFAGIPFFDTTSGKVYQFTGSGFTEITPLILANIDEVNSPLQAALVAAIANIPATSPGPLVLPALVGMQSPQITAGPGLNVPTTPTAAVGTNSIQLATCAFANSAGIPTIVIGSNSFAIKFPLTYPASPGGAPLTFATIQMGLGNGFPSGGAGTAVFDPAFTSIPYFCCAGYTEPCVVQTIGTGSATVSPIGGSTNFSWIAIGVTN